MAICKWCGGNPCGCGAAEYAEEANQDVTGGPYYHLGFVFYIIKSWVNDSYRYVFYLGAELVADIEVSEQWIRERVKGWEDSTPYIMELFQLTQGYRDNIEYIHKNEKGRRYKFTITAEPADDEDYWVSIDGHRNYVREA